MRGKHGYPSLTTFQINTKENVTLTAPLKLLLHLLTISFQSRLMGLEK